MFARLVAIGTLISLLCASAVAKESPTPSATSEAQKSAATPNETKSLAPDQLERAAKSDSVTIPTPGELFSALAKPAKPDWAARLHGEIPTNFKTRAQIALNLGGLIADGFIAVEAQDAQQVKNIGGDIVKMAKALGVSESILSRGNSINQFAENQEWSTLQEELEATQNEVKNSMQTHRDQDLIILVSLGGWIRGTQVVSGIIAKNYDAKLGQVLRQPELLRFIRSKIGQISPEMQNDPLVKSVNAQLEEIEKIVGKPFGQALTEPEVASLNDSVNKLMQEIQKKDQ